MSKNSKGRGRDKFGKYKTLIHLFVKILSIFPKTLRIYLFEMFRHKRGLTGLGIRYILLKSIGKQVGDNVSVFPGVYLLSPDQITIGNNVSIHPMCYLDATGEIVIGDDVSIAHGTTIMSSTHAYEDTNKPIKDQPIEYNKTVIDNNVWIGSKVTILNGLTIEKGSVVAASAVVTKNVTTNSVVAGIPAKLIKHR